MIIMIIIVVVVVIIIIIITIIIMGEWASEWDTIRGNTIKKNWGYFFIC